MSVNEYFHFPIDITFKCFMFFQLEVPFKKKSFPLIIYSEAFSAEGNSL